MSLRLVISDVDGTLVDHDKQLAPATVAAVARLQAAGVAFTIISARPPSGIAWLRDALHPAGPIAAFNGGTIVAPDGSQNYSAFRDDEINSLMDQARATGDPDARAKLVAQAGDKIATQLPWIPMAAPDNVLITSSNLSGAPASFVYMGGPWANLLGGK